MKFSFVMLTWNRYRFLEKSLEALLGSIGDLSECEIIVLDNGSSDQTRDVLNRYKNESFFRVLARRQNHGLNAYKRLFGAALGEYIVDVDDDVLSFPTKCDHLFADYMETFPDYGYLALNVVQNEFTNGARPPLEEYTEDTRGGKTVLRGPTGGWCACFRRSDYRKLHKDFLSVELNMAYGEDTFLTEHLEAQLDLKSGIIRDAFCLHASGPCYAKQYGHLDREIEKYASANLDTFVEDYRNYRDSGDDGSAES
jgi:glycosyltransferase involved in cell wall biosynthesis